MICVPDVASVEVLMVSVPGLPEGVTEFGLREQVEPLEPGTTQARDTAFVNPPIDTTFTAAVAEPPGTTWRAMAKRLQSGNRGWRNYLPAAGQRQRVKCSLILLL